MLVFGLLGAWLALTGILSAPFAAPMKMAAASVLAGAPICGEHTDQPAGGEPAGEQHKMVDCALCCCCAPVLATLSSPPAPPPPARVVVAVFAPVPPARAPPATILASAYPRGPPASI